jgi:hypothetical protein
MDQREEGTAGGYVLIQAQPGHPVPELERVRRVPGVARAERVQGAYDLVAEVPEDHPGLLRAEGSIRQLDGVLRAITLSARRASGGAAA